MIGRNPYVALFELEVIRGRRLADLAAAAELFRPMRDAFARVGIAVGQALEAFRPLTRALESIAEELEHGR